MMPGFDPLTLQQEKYIKRVCPALTSEIFFAQGDDNNNNNHNNNSDKMIQRKTEFRRAFFIESNSNSERLNWK